MTVHVKVGARRDGTLTALQLRIVSNTGAYGCHGGSVLFHSTGESVGVYRCPNKKIDAYAVYTNTVPAGAFRGYGLSQTIFAIESAMDELARRLRMDPIEFRSPQRHSSRRRDDFVCGPKRNDVDYGELRPGPVPGTRCAKRWPAATASLVPPARSGWRARASRWR